MRVTVIESLKEGVLRIFGERELIKGKVLGKKSFNVLNRANPCIKLDSGNTIINILW